MSTPFHDARPRRPPDARHLPPAREIADEDRAVAGRVRAVVRRRAGRILRGVVFAVRLPRQLKNRLHYIIP